MSNQQTSVNLSGIERNKYPTLANDGSASYCHNLRPTNTGLELIKNKKLKFRIGDILNNEYVIVKIPYKRKIGDKVFDYPTDNINISHVFRHNYLPFGYYIIVFNNRAITLWKPDEKDDSVLIQVDDNTNAYNGVYPGLLNEDVILITSFNNNLIIHTANKQYIFVYSNMHYMILPTPKYFRYQQLDQCTDFSKNAFASREEANVYSGDNKKNRYFRYVKGFPLTGKSIKDNLNKVDYLYDIYEQNINKCLEDIKDINLKEENNYKKIGMFIGHVLVRTSFKNSNNEHLIYGPILHTEIGSWYGSHREVDFGYDETGLSDEKLVGDALLYDDYTADTYNKKLIGPYDNTLYINDNGTPSNVKRDFYGGLYPIKKIMPDASELSMEIKLYDKDDSEFNNIDENHNIPYSCNAGFSQPPVWIGALPRFILKKHILYAHEREIPGKLSGIYADGETVFPDDFQSDNDSPYSIYTGNTEYFKCEWARSIFIGVYAPSTFYSYPILRLFISNNDTEEELSIDSLKRLYKEGVIEKLCVSMTAPIKHGINKLRRVNTVGKRGIFSINTDENINNEQENNLKKHDMYNKSSDDDLLYIYGYETNPDIKEENLMDSIFYIVKEIDVKDILDDIRVRRNCRIVDDGYEYIIPILLNTNGTKGTISNGEIRIETIEPNSEGYYQNDRNLINLENIHQALPLPIDNFTSQNITSTVAFEYNRRLHLLGGSTIFCAGYDNTPILYNNNEFGITEFSDTDTELFFEYKIFDGSSYNYIKSPIRRYVCPKGRKDIMILSDIITYPDARCENIRIIKKDNKNTYELASWKCKQSLLNNLSYYANTNTTKKVLPDIRIKSKTSDYNSTIQLYTDVHFKHKVEHYVHDINTGWKFENYYIVDTLYLSPKSYSFKADKLDVITNLLYAFNNSNTIYYPIIIDLLGGKQIELDESLYNKRNYRNLVYVSEIDNHQIFNIKNRYEIGTRDNIIHNYSSMYGQVTEQKFGMYPFYIFTKEGIFTMEQGTGEVLYQSVSKINDDHLTHKNSVCTVGDMVAYMADNGLKLIQGKQTQFVGEAMLGKPYAIEEDQYTMSGKEFIDDTLGSIFLYDSFNRDVLMLCPNKSTTGNHLIWAFNMASNKYFQRGDIINKIIDGNKCFDSINTILNEKSYLYGGRIEVVSTQPMDNNYNKIEQISTNAVITPPPTIDPSLPTDPSEPDVDDAGTEGKVHYETKEYKVAISIWDYNDADTLTPNVDNELNFTYVSNLYKLGINGYKHLERLVLRAFGNVASLKITLYGSLDGRKCYKIGESKDISAIDDPTLRRSPCSFVYFGFSIKGEAIGDGSKVALDDIMLQINSIDIELQQRYAAKLR